MASVGGMISMKLIGLFEVFFGERSWLFRNKFFGLAVGPFSNVFPRFGLYQEQGFNIQTFGIV